MSRYVKLRSFIDHVPRNASMVYVTGWHIIAAELMKKMVDVCDAAEEVVAQLEYADPHSDADTSPVRHLRARLTLLHSAVNKAARDDDAEVFHRVTTPAAD